MSVDYDSPISSEDACHPLGFLFLEKPDLNALGIIESFASGAILAMLADSMMPEAYEDGGFIIGFLTMLGFLTAFILSKI